MAPNQRNETDPGPRISYRPRPVSETKQTPAFKAREKVSVGPAKRMTNKKLNAEFLKF